MLYDCGRYGSEDAAESAAASLLWQKRIRKLDAVFISHADSDHFNGLPGLAKKFRIDRVIISKNLERNLAQNPMFQNALGALEQEGVLRNTVSEGDLLGFGSSPKLAILNPPHHSFSTSDNEDSVVIEIEFQGIRVLLPGDLEGHSLSRLLQSNSSKYDIAMAPHHGSRNSEPDEFIQWCRPSVLIASAGRGKNTEILDYAARPPYPTILHTAHTGAVQIEIQNHAFQVKTWQGVRAEFPIKFAHPRVSNIPDYE